MADSAIFLDGNHQLHRCYRTVGTYSAVPEKRVALMVLHYFCTYAIEKNARYGALCIDGDEVFRYQIYPDYKKNRRADGGASPEDRAVMRGSGEGLSTSEIKEQVYKCLLPTMRLFDLLGLPCYQHRELEADDLMSSGAYAFTRDGDSRVYIPGRKAYIITPDKDAVQRVDKQVTVYRPSVGKTPGKEFTIPDVIEARGMRPKQFADYQALIGDDVDDIPALLSPKKAKDAILKNGSLRKFLETPEGKDFWYKNERAIRRNVQLVRLSYKAWAPSINELKLFNRNYDRKLVVDEYGKLPEAFLALEMLCKKKGLF